MTLYSRKYRPSKIDDVVGHQDIKRKLRSYLKTGDVPHMMFIGPPGIGKNCLAYAFATEFFGRKITIGTKDGDEDYKELNASMDRGIDIVRNTIVPFMERRAISVPQQIIFLDEFDAMTYAAQLALKQPTEENEDKCIVIFSLNNENGVKVDALHSRCAKFYFKSPTHTELKDYLYELCKKEGFELESEQLADDIVNYYGSDIRHMLIDGLEAIKGYKGEGTYTITERDFPKIYMEKDLDLADKVYNADDPKKEFFKTWRSEAVNCRQFLENYYQLVNSNSKLFAIIDRNIRNGCSEMIQMSYLFDSL